MIKKKYYENLILSAALHGQNNYGKMLFIVFGPNFIQPGPN